MQVEFVFVKKKCHVRNSNEQRTRDTIRRYFSSSQLHQLAPWCQDNLRIYLATTFKNAKGSYLSSSDIDGLRDSAVAHAMKALVIFWYGSAL